MSFSAIFYFRLTNFDYIFGNTGRLTNGTPPHYQAASLQLNIHVSKQLPMEALHPPSPRPLVPCDACHRAEGGPPTHSPRPRYRLRPYDGAKTVDLQAHNAWRTDYGREFADRATPPQDFPHPPTRPYGSYPKRTASYGPTAVEHSSFIIFIFFYSFLSLI